MRRIDALLLALAALATVALMVALAASGSPGLTVAIYVYGLAALVVARLVAAVARAFPASPPPARPRPQRPTEQLAQLESVAEVLALAEASSYDLHNRLRPIVREVAAARLARSGVALDTQPQRARALLGEPTWDLVRPDREPPAGRLERGWSRAELRAVVDALEAIR